MLTVIGPDRPGLVEELAATVATHGGNWLESRMARLGGEFAGIVRIEIDSASVDAATAALTALDGLTVTARASSHTAATAAASCVDLELLGADLMVDIILADVS